MYCFEDLPYVLYTILSCTIFLGLLVSFIVNSAEFDDDEPDVLEVMKNLEKAVMNDEFLFIENGADPAVPADKESLTMTEAKQQDDGK